MLGCWIVCIHHRAGSGRTRTTLLDDVLKSLQDKLEFDSVAVSSICHSERERRICFPVASVACSRSRVRRTRISADEFLERAARQAAVPTQRRFRFAHTLPGSDWSRATALA